MWKAWAAALAQSAVEFIPFSSSDTGCGLILGHIICSITAMIVVVLSFGCLVLRFNCISDVIFHKFLTQSELQV